MYQVRIHGRGGQGVVTAAELLSVAAFDEGRHAQAFPTFGSERTGAPVISFCRISDRPIRVREPIFAPDAIIIQDPTLLRTGALLAGLRPGGPVVVNTERRPEDLGLDVDARLLTVPASAIAREHLGRPLPNAALLGGLSALEGIVGLEALATALREKFPAAIAEANVAAATAAHDHVATELLAC
jgi:pyruvate ferredoxin oxidoreductase gamma subunit